MATRTFLIAFLAMTVTGCAAFQTGTPVRDAKLSEQAVVLNVPVVLQDDQYDCGVSVLSMLLAYYGTPSVPERAQVLRGRAEEEEGLRGADLENYMKAEGYETALFEGELGSSIHGLYYHLDRGRPLVVALNAGTDSNHFVLVTGYDPVKDWVLIQDPERGALVSVAGQFEHSWSKASHFTMLATPGE